MSNSEVASSSESVKIKKKYVFLESNTTFDNIRVYITWKLAILQRELQGELELKRTCCHRVRPRCRLCYEKRCFVKYDSIRRKFIALNRLKEMQLAQKSSIKGVAV